MRDPKRRHRQTILWQGHDYAAGGTYFVTVCTSERICLFGDVHDGTMYVNAMGRIVEDEWVRTGAIRAEVDIDVFAVMPNHLYGLVTIRSDESQQVSGVALAHRRAPLRRTPRSLGSVIAAFKQATTIRIDSARAMAGASVWQRGYHDRVDRNDIEFEAIAEYITTNPERWRMDEEQP